MEKTDLHDRIADLPLMDAHTHLVGGKLAARGLHDILLYHMAVSDLYAAGAPSGKRLTQYPRWPSVEEAHARIEEALPYLKYVRNTSISWGIRIILRDLYGWTEEITDNNWRKLDDLIRERADDKVWQRDVISRSRVARFCAEFARREEGQDDDMLQYALEWAFFTRCQWGEFDTALYEVERCWGRLPESPSPIGGKRPATEKVVRTIDDAREAVAWYVDHIPAEQLVAATTHISTDIDFRLVNETEMAAALARRENAGPAERDIYASFINELFLTELERKLGDKLTLQFSFGAEPLPFETASRLSQRTIAQLGEMIGRHPKLRFQCFLASQHANQTICTLCRELPNLSVAGYWWHNFFPPIIRRLMEERLDMLPTNKQVGFFSDAYCIEWAYAKARMVKHELAKVLSAKVDDGQCDAEMAVGIAREMLFETAQGLLGMEPGP